MHHGDGVLNKKPLADIDPAALTRALAPAARPLVSTKAKSEETPPARAPRSSKSILLPDYVWDEIRVRYGATGKPTNLQILEALKAVGVTVRDEDLIDGRKLR